VRRLAAGAGFAVAEWLQGPDLLTRVGEVAGSGVEAMSIGVEGVGLSLLMPDFEVRMAGVARNIVEQRVELAMAVFRRE